MGSYRMNADNLEKSLEDLMESYLPKGLTWPFGSAEASVNIMTIDDVISARFAELGLDTFSKPVTQPEPTSPVDDLFAKLRELMEEHSDETEETADVPDAESLLDQLRDLIGSETPVSSTDPVQPLLDAMTADEFAFKDVIRDSEDTSHDTYVSLSDIIEAKGAPLKDGIFSGVDMPDSLPAPVDVKSFIHSFATDADDFLI